MQYPNRVITKGETDKALVTAIQKQLNAKGCGPIDEDGDFGTNTVRAVKLFQTRNSDAKGNPLEADGMIGAITWATLFGTDQVPVANTGATGLLKKVLEVAASQIGVIEQPPYSNRGPEVDLYLRTVGLNPEGQHYSWCMAFVYWCFNEAAKSLTVKNPLVKTAGCLNQWNSSTCPKIKMDDAVNNPSLVQPGFIFIIDHGGGNGHTGLVESVNGGMINTIEGNTNNDGSANGYGVLRLTRKIGKITKGFLDYRQA
jgi:hypothetical protein